MEKLKENGYLYLTKDKKKICLYDKYNSNLYTKEYNEGDNKIPINIREINRLLSDKPDAKVEDTGKLQHLRLLVNNKCNLKCIYCYANHGDYGKKNEDMSLDIIKNTFVFFYSKFKSVNQVSFFGGEPLLSLAIIDEACNYINNFCQENGIDRPKYSIVTNATLLDEKTLKILIEHKINVVASIDGPKYLNDSQRMFKNSDSSVFEKVSKNIKLLRKYQNYTIEATLTNKISKFNLTKNEIRRFLIDEFQVNRINISKLTVTEEKLRKFDYTDENQMKDRINSFFDNDEKYVFDDVIIKLIHLFGTRFYCNRYCDAGINQYTVDMSGDIYPCQIFVNDSEHLMGNVMYPNKLAKMTIDSQKKEIKCSSCGNIRFCSKCLKGKKADEYHCSKISENVDLFLKRIIELKVVEPNKYLDMIEQMRTYYEESGLK